MTWQSQFQSVSTLHSFPFMTQTKMVVLTSIHVSRMLTPATLWSHSWPPTTLHYHITTVACHSLLYAFNMKPPTHLCKNAATPCNTSSTTLNLEHLCHTHPIPHVMSYFISAQYN